MPLILFNIGWMKHYRGQTRSDRIFNGGKYVLENKTGNEIENFKSLAGRCYAYVSARANKINLCRVGAKGDAASIDGVTVVFTATRPAGAPSSLAGIEMPEFGVKENRTGIASILLKPTRLPALYSLVTRACSLFPALVLLGLPSALAKTTFVIWTNPMHRRLVGSWANT